MQRRDALDDAVDLVLDRVPDVVEAFLRKLELALERLGVVLDAELVVRDAVAEVEPGGEGQVRLEDEAELREETLAARRGVRDEQARLCRVVDLRREQGKSAPLVHSARRRTF